jgi:hypothetical protein
MYYTTKEQMDFDTDLVEQIINDWMADDFKYGEASTCLTDAEYNAIEAAENANDHALAKALMDKGVRRFLESSTRDIAAEFDKRVKHMTYQSRYDHSESIYEDRKAWA